MDPQLPTTKLPCFNKLPGIGLTSRLRNGKANESHAGAEGHGISFVHLSSLPENFTQQPGSMTIPNPSQIAQGPVPAHDLPSLRASGMTAMPQRSLKRSRIPQQDSEISIVSPDVKIEATQDESIAPPPPKRRKQTYTKRHRPPASITWKVVETIPRASGPVLDPGVGEPTTGKSRARGRGRGGRGRGGRGRGRGRGGITAVSETSFPDSTQATLAAVVDVPAETVPGCEQVHPRQWASCKNELFAILPELNTHVNGVVQVSETPIIILDGTNGITVSNTSSVDGIVLDLCIVGDFIREPEPAPTVAKPSSPEPIPTSSYCDRPYLRRHPSSTSSVPITSANGIPSKPIPDSRVERYFPSSPVFPQRSSTGDQSYYRPNHNAPDFPSSSAVLQRSSTDSQSYHRSKYNAPSPSSQLSDWNRDVRAASTSLAPPVQNFPGRPSSLFPPRYNDIHFASPSFSQPVQLSHPWPSFPLSQQYDAVHSTSHSFASSVQRPRSLPSSHYRNRVHSGPPSLPFHQQYNIHPVQPDEQSLEAIRRIAPEGLISLDDEVEETLPIVSFPSPAALVPSPSTESETLTYPSTPIRVRLEQYDPIPCPAVVLSSAPPEHIVLSTPEERRHAQPHIRTPAVLSSASLEDIPPSTPEETQRRVLALAAVLASCSLEDIPAPEETQRAQPHIQILASPTVLASGSKNNVPPSKPVGEQRTSPTPAPAAVLSCDSEDAKLSGEPPSNPPEISAVPRPIPKEMQVLVDAYIHHTPVLCITTNTCMRNSWGVTLPSEIQFAYLGFHTVVSVQEERVPQDEKEPASSDLAGRVKWHFKLQWGSGGEVNLDLSPETLAKIDFPWWLPTTEGTIVESVPSDDDDASTPEYKHRRLQSHNYSFRNIPIAGRCPSILPPHLLGPQNDSAEIGFDQEETVDEDSRRYQDHRGWYCGECGKLNRVMMMRHRRCNSSFCASKISDQWDASGGYSVPLESMRTPHETTPVYLPKATLPPGVVEPTPLQWSDGMVVLRYDLGINRIAEQPRQWDLKGEVSVQHIFTGNVPSLQLDATELLDSIQTGCLLRREAFDSPYFGHTAVMEPETLWPECLSRAREVIAQSIKTYVCTKNQKMDVDIHQLLVKGWVDRMGWGGGLFNIAGSGNCAAIMCLGHGMKLKIYPKSQANPATTINGALVKLKVEEKPLGDAPKPRKRRKVKAETCDDVKLGESDVVVLEPSSAGTLPEEVAAPKRKRTTTKGTLPPAVQAREDHKSEVLDDAAGEPSSRGVSTRAEKVVRGPRTKPSPFITTLVHGDILFLSGDEFQYSIVRSGTSILLVAVGQENL
ncbi:hypothetical protein K438DRAFT_1825620 [Mycena galopus ATCC 62051]|nr:hypothetical protein K438DRAFT_1825620 [Mycena galopus ATCC 62051]